MDKFYIKITTIGVYVLFTVGFIWFSLPILSDSTPRYSHIDPAIGFLFLFGIVWLCFTKFIFDAFRTDFNNLSLRGVSLSRLLLVIIFFILVLLFILLPHFFK